MVLPSYAVIFRGKPACPCLATWIPAYERELQRRGALEGELPIFQLIGTADASAGVHAAGGAFDVTDLRSDLDVWVARQMGADATWARVVGFKTVHVHGVLTGCPHNGPARYQIDAVRAGFNGLGALGRGGPDDGPRPLSGRTWQQGIEWQREQEDDMPEPKDWTEADRETVRGIVRGVVRDEIRAALKEGGSLIKIDADNNSATPKTSLEHEIRQLKKGTRT